jgi:hypothetical protein
VELNALAGQAFLIAASKNGFGASIVRDAASKDAFAASKNDLPQVNGRLPQVNEIFEGEIGNRRNADKFPESWI